MYTINVIHFVVEILLYLWAPIHCKNIVSEVSTMLYVLVSRSLRYGPSPLLSASSWRGTTQGTTLHSILTTGHRRDNQVGTGGGIRESVEEEGQRSLWHEDEFRGKEVLLQEWVEAAVCYTHVVYQASSKPLSFASSAPHENFPCEYLSCTCKNSSSMKCTKITVEYEVLRGKLLTVYRGKSRYVLYVRCVQCTNAVHTYVMQLLPETSGTLDRRLFLMSRCLTRTRSPTRSLLLHPVSAIMRSQRKGLRAKNSWGWTWVLHSPRIQYHRRHGKTSINLLQPTGLATGWEVSPAVCHNDGVAFMSFAILPIALINSVHPWHSITSKLHSTTSCILWSGCRWITCCCLTCSHFPPSFQHSICV